MKAIVSRACAAALLVASALAAQSSVFDKPPAGVEDALRARATKFYQAFVDGKFRLADEVVAEDSKDQFFAARKVRFGGFKIDRIVFEDNFTRARVVTLVDTEMDMVGQRIKVKAPQTSLWKVEKGEWWWYVYESAEYADTPFGKVKRPKPEEAREGPAPAVATPDLNMLARAVKPEKSVVEFGARSASTQTVRIDNLASGPVTLGIRPVTVPGLTAKLDRTDVSAKGSTELRLSYEPGKEPAKGRARVDLIAFPSNTTIPIEVRFVDTPRGK